MTNEESTGQVSANENGDFSKDKKRDEEQPLPFHNPLKAGKDKQITQKDLENEQKYKEALSERD